MAPAVTSTFLVDGRRVGWHVYGDPSDRPILFLHGWGMLLSGYRRALDALAGSGWAVHACDLPGFGRSEPLPLRCSSLGGYAQFVAQAHRVGPLRGGAGGRGRAFVRGGNRRPGRRGGPDDLRGTAAHLPGRRGRVIGRVVAVAGPRDGPGVQPGAGDQGVRLAGSDAAQSAAPVPVGLRGEDRGPHQRAGDTAPPACAGASGPRRPRLHRARRDGSGQHRRPRHGSSSATTGGCCATRRSSRPRPAGSLQRPPRSPAGRVGGRARPRPTKPPTP